MDVKEKLSSLPTKPGVYLMKNEQGKVIYVGKAVNLKSRVRSYFNSANQTVKEQIMVPKIADLETIVTDSEVEALILENNLIKKYRPKYNVNLKDDKNYPYLKVTTEEKFPRIIVVRSMGKQGRYFGPYPNSGAARETIKLLRKLFPVRTCKGETPKNRVRPCLNYYIDRCLAPCTSQVSQAGYREMIDQIIAVLEGKEENLINDLNEKMNKAASNMEFEQAAEYRNQKEALEKIREKQKIVSDRKDDYDVLAVDSQEDRACAQIFFIRGGKLMGRNNFKLYPGEGDDKTEMLTAFLKQYYGQAPGAIPKEILLSHPVADDEIIQEWLSQLRGSKVDLRVPQRGQKYQLMNMAQKNARLELEQQELDQEKERKMTEGALKELTLKLNLQEHPYRIECYDVSHTQGEETVASMVVFEGGEPQKSDYRRFKLRTVDKPDDYQSMLEALERRFNRAREEVKENKPAEELKFAILPDLIIIDGGKGQLNRAAQVLEETGYEDIPIVSVAKREEEIFIPGEKEPLRIPNTSEALKLIQRLRDEAHRFAITYHRKSRTKASLTSILDEVPEIGAKRKQELFQHYNSIDEMKQADEDSIAELPSMNKKAAKNLLSYLNRSTDQKNND